MCDVFCIATPFPIHVVSPRKGDEAYSYNMVWANPKTGGRPIDTYSIRFRQVHITRSHRSASVL